MKKVLIVAIILGVAWMVLHRPSSNLPRSSEPLPAPEASHVMIKVDDNSSAVRAEKALMAPAESIVPANPSPQAQSPSPKAEAHPNPQETISIETASRLAWDSMLTKPKDMDEFFALDG